MTALAISLAFVALCAWDAARRFLSARTAPVAVDAELVARVMELEERVAGMDDGIANVVGRVAVLEAQPAGDDVLARISRQDDVIVRAVNEMRDLLAPVRSKILGAVPGRAGKDPLAELNGAAR